VFQGFHLIPALTAIENAVAPVLPFRTTFSGRSVDRPRVVVEKPDIAASRRHGRGGPPPEGLIHHGPVEQILDDIRACEPSGIDLLYLWPSIPDVRQVELLAEGVLPHYLG
jgi:hypothetical protein